MIYLFLGTILMVLVRLVIREKHELLVWVFTILFWPFILAGLFILILEDLLMKIKI